MSTTETVKTQIQSLIDSANATTGKQDTNLTDGVNALIKGYGQGSGSSSRESLYETSAQGIKPNVIVGTGITDMIPQYETSASLYVEEE